MQKLSKICVLRIVVGYLGEKAQSAWWDSAFLNAIGFRYLGLVYPKTAPAAAVTSACEAACRIHDERIGRGRVAHLFRLSSEIETPLRSELVALSIEQLQKICSPDAAFEQLDAIAAGAKPIAGVGPIQIGAVVESSAPGALSRVAATYAAAFRSGAQVFPYFV